MIARRATFPAAWKYLLPCCLIFGLYLLAFYPGLFSEDSWILWRQITDHSGSPQRSMQAHEERAPCLDGASGAMTIPA